MQNILVIEDHETTSRTIRLYLERDGYKVETHADGISGLAAAKQSYFDLIIVDLMLPGLDGREICQRLRKETNKSLNQIPIIMLTALSTQTDILKGFNLGADDYVTKPFSPNELIARVKARLRKSSNQKSHLICIGNLCLDRQQRTLTKAGDLVSLTKSEYSLLECLMSNSGRAYSRDELIDKAMDQDFQGHRRNIDMHISNLRKRIESDSLAPVFIETVVGYGYRFCKILQ